MIEYKTNVAYEKDRNYFIHLLYRDTGDERAIRNLLKQSKWVGSVDTAFDDGYHAGYIEGANDDDD